MSLFLALLGCGGGSAVLNVWEGPCCDGTPIAHGDYLVGWGWITDSDASGAGLVTYHAWEGGGVVGRQSFGPIGGAPALGADDLVLVPSDTLRAIAPGGGIFWDQYLPALASTPVSIAHDGAIWVGTEAGSVHVFDRDGNAIGAAGLYPYAPVGRVAIDGDGVAYGFARHVSPEEPEQYVLYALAPDASVRYVLPVDVPLAQPALIGETLVAGAYRGPVADLEGEAPDFDLAEMVAYDLVTGEETWAWPTGGQPSTAVETERGEVVFTVDAALVGLDGGDVAFETDAGTTLWEPTVGDDGRFYVGCDTGLCVFRPNGKLDVAYALDAPVYQPVVLHNGWAIANVGRTLMGVPLDRDVRPAPTWARAGADNRGTGAR